jgi:hypothetical protein
MDPFSLAMMAISAVKSGVALYKEAKSVGKETIGVITEISQGLGSFFEHQDKAIKEDEEKKKNPPVGKSLQAIALDNVLRRKQLQQAEYDLRQMLTYQAPPELGALWTEFAEERAKLMKDKAKFDEAQKKRMHKSEENEKNELPYGILGLQYVLQSWLSSSRLSV